MTKTFAHASVAVAHYQMSMHGLIAACIASTHDYLSIVTFVSSSYLRLRN